MQDGEEVDDFHFEYGSVYQREIVLKVRNGILVGSEIVDYQPSEAVLRKKRYRKPSDELP